jgi:hypothetical protein
MGDRIFTTNKKCDDDVQIDSSLNPSYVTMDAFSRMYARCTDDPVYSADLMRSPVRMHTARAMKIGHTSRSVRTKAALIPSEKRRLSEILSMSSVCLSTPEKASTVIAGLL